MKDILAYLRDLVYQEQIMQLAQKLPVQFGRSDRCAGRWAKRSGRDGNHHAEKFVTRAVLRGMKRKGGEIFNLMAQFADYGFNRIIV